MIDVSAFKKAMGRFPSGVVIATTVDGAGRPWGFTASSFSSVSLDPPLILVCPAKAAECHAAFIAATVFSINMLGSDGEAMARRFATRGVSKFESDDVVPGEQGLPLIRSAVATLICRKFADHDCGDHSLIVGKVQSVKLAEGGDSLVYYRQKYGCFAERPARELGRMTASASSTQRARE
jgi:flavin reductase (DIM6/NTAB) family NADH-FMN oxidoreductase RutF